MMQSISWFQPELLSAGSASEPEERTHRQVEEVTRMRDHILDTKTEIDRELADAPANIFSMKFGYHFPDIEDESIR